MKFLNTIRLVDKQNKKNDMNIVEKLSKYGTVKTCKLVHKNVATIVITKAFNGKAIETFAFLKECSECFPDHTIMGTCITEPDFAMVVLVKPE